MIKVQGKIPRQVYVAFSGGVDSTAVLDFVVRNHDVTIAHFHHGNEMADEEVEYAYRASREYGVPLLLDYGISDAPSGMSLEEYWRDQRYEFFYSIGRPVITCHHLDDCVETYIWRMLNGRQDTIAYTNRNVIRPFRLTSKKEFYRWCANNELDFYEDETNFDADFGTRNFIRNVLLPNALQVNPGLHKVVAKMIVKDMENHELLREAWNGLCGPGYYAPPNYSVVEEWN